MEDHVDVTPGYETSVTHATRHTSEDETPQRAATVDASSCTTEDRIRTGSARPRIQTRTRIESNTCKGNARPVRRSHAEPSLRSSLTWSAGASFCVDRRNPKPERPRRHPSMERASAVRSIASSSRVRTFSSRRGGGWIVARSIVVRPRGLVRRTCACVSSVSLSSSSTACVGWMDRWIDGSIDVGKCVVSSRLSVESIRSATPRRRWCSRAFSQQPLTTLRRRRGFSSFLSRAFPRSIPVRSRTVAFLPFPSSTSLPSRVFRGPTLARMAVGGSGSSTHRL